ncbi:Lipid transfer-like protein VAS [Ananas comosus]|uniref:Lipid transfer-like protein VAS n=1 Tax=Ananas comosus TaxID=4615 RepID=A0A199VKV9_ANACO|nr:Lipid transfer-like protein VAS [Ananas comosus]
MAIIGGGGGAAVVAAVMVMAVAVAVVEGQGSGAVPECASKLVGCAQYLNGTGTPPATCCGPLKEAATNETACLCAVLNDTAVLRAFNVDPAQGLLLAKRCGVSTDSATCSKAAASPASQNNGAVQSRSWTGAFSLTSLLFAGWAVMV